MTALIPIVDTNVVVAGLLTARALSPVARVLEGMLMGAFPFVLSDALLAEYRDVLLRPKLQKLHGMAVEDVDGILTDLAKIAIVLQPGRASHAPEPGDQFLWDLLVVRPDLILVTGDHLLLKCPDMAGRVLTAQTFCETRLG